MRNATTYVLWDIDRTLTEVRGFGREMYEQAFPVVAGRPLDRWAEAAGRTELDILRAILRENGLDGGDDTLVANLATELAHAFDANRNELARRGRALPGAAAVLAALSVEPSVYQSVLTGNLRSVARIKLETFGLDAHIDFEVGAYGEDHQDRYRLVDFARERAADKLGYSFSQDKVILIGDTPKDVEAALGAGVPFIGVASGGSSVADLRKAGASVVFPALAPIEAVVRHVLAVGAGTV